MRRNLWCLSSREELFSCIHDNDACVCLFGCCKIKKNMWLFVSTSPKRPSILKSILKPRKPAYYIYTKVLPECKTPGTVSPFLVAGLNESRGGCGSNGAFRDREERAGQGTDREWRGPSVGSQPGQAASVNLTSQVIQAKSLSSRLDWAQTLILRAEAKFYTCKKYISFNNRISSKVQTRTKSYFNHAYIV